MGHEVAGGHLEERRKGEQQRCGDADMCAVNLPPDRIDQHDTKCAEYRRHQPDRSHQLADGQHHRVAKGVDACPAPSRIHEEARVEEIEGVLDRRARGREVERGEDLRLEDV